MKLLSRIAAVDGALSSWLLARPDRRLSRQLTILLSRISQTGSYGVGWILVFACTLTWLVAWEVALAASVCVIGTLSLNSAVKFVVRRPRPPTPFGHAPSTYSFPSAHTSMAVVGASIMTAEVPQGLPAWWGWALVLAASRVMLGMHFVGDVVAGAVLGGVIAWALALPLLELARTL